MKKGISLIVLVITIIVMIILAASVVISLNNTGIIDRASQAVKLTDEKQVQDLASLAWVDAYLDETRTDTIEKVVKDKLAEQGVTEDKWSITVTDTGVTVTVKSEAAEAKFTFVLIKKTETRTEYTFTTGMTWLEYLKDGLNETNSGPVVESAPIEYVTTDMTVNVTGFNFYCNGQVVKYGDTIIPNAEYIVDLR